MSLPTMLCSEKEKIKKIDLRKDNERRTDTNAREENTHLENG